MHNSHIATAASTEGEPTAALLRAPPVPSSQAVQVSATTHRASTGTLSIKPFEFLQLPIELQHRVSKAVQVHALRIEFRKMVYCELLGAITRTLPVKPSKFLRSRLSAHSPTGTPKRA